MKLVLKEKAIHLRKLGKTYKEILSVIPVAKSTLSLWLRSVGLAEYQQQRITHKRLSAALKGAQARRNKRIGDIETYVRNGKTAIGHISKRELWLIGIALYWAEGSKQNVRSPSAGIAFGNSDYKMLLVFMAWLRDVGIAKQDITYELYVHTDRQNEIPQFKRWWAKKLGISAGAISRTYLKKGNIKTTRINVGDLYHGLIRIKVKSSSQLNRQINGWTEGIVASLGGRLKVGQGTLNPLI